ncbi:MAG: PfkB family carbohydrate kinase [Acidobacteriota bacterium]
MTEKILAFEDLVERVESLRAAGRRVVLCHGVFDLIHVGHLRYLQAARRLGDTLIVTLTPDRWVDKGPYRPAFDEDLRLEAMAALEVVDLVALNAWPTAEETLRRIRPDVYAKGAEFKNPGDDPTGKMELERGVATEVGCELAFIDEITFSSSQLINRHLPIYPDSVARYLDTVRQRHSLDDVLAILDRLAALRTLVIGDAILDEYTYVEALGKASKDPALAVRHLDEERFAGGAVAVANHVAAFGGQVELIGVVGDDEAGDFLADNLAPGARARFIRRPGMPTVRKHRVVDSYSSNKLLSIYRMDVSPPDASTVATLIETIREAARDVDLVICADYGHQAIPAALIPVICDLPCFLAVNTQANAGNHGYHTVTRYQRADFVCLAEHEIRLETRDSEGELRPMMNEVADQLATTLSIVTRGKRGCLTRDADGVFHEAPALATRIVDRVGAGDAFFALAAQAVKVGASAEIVSLLGNTAGAQGVEIVGNRHALDASRLRKQLTAMLR